MIIYIIERDNPDNRPYPEVLLNGREALKIVRDEYREMMSLLGTDQERADSGFGAYGCYFEIDEMNCVGSALIASDYDSDRWEWRITVHEI